MFEGLTDFGKKRTGDQALGFYLAYLFLTMLMGGIAGMVVGVLSLQGNFMLGLRIGTIIAGITCGVLAYLVLDRQHRMKDFSSTLIILVCAALALLGGALFGLIIPAFLTTRERA